MRRLAIAAGVAVTGWALAQALPALACPLPAPALQQGAVQAAWQVDGAAIAVARPFAITLRLCPADALLLRVDATMPAHRHGMNYRPSVQALGDGRWRAEGLLFHMPGQWQLRLEVRGENGVVQLLDEVVLR